MDVIIVKYVQLVCISIFMRNNANCAQLMSQSEEMNNMKVAACAADCLKTEINYNFTNCYQQCANRTESLQDVNSVYGPPDASFRLYCRDAKRLVILVENKKKSDDDGHVENEKFIYLLVIQETTMKFVDRYVYISDEPMIELHDLKPSESYNISATIVSSNYDVQFLDTQIFTTLKNNYVPENITDIWVARFDPIAGDDENVTAVIGWDPARDQTCLYEIILHGYGDNGDMLLKEKSNRDLYYQEYQNLKYDSEYSVAVRGINTENLTLESETVWIQFKIPRCMELYKNESVCGPEPIENLAANFTYIGDNKFSVEVTWNPMNYNPEFFTLEIKGGKSPKGNGTGKNYHYRIKNNQNQTSIFVKSVFIDGFDAMVNLTAHHNKQTKDGYLYVRLSHLKIEKPRSRVYDIFVYTIFVVILILFVFLYCVWQGRISLPITQKQIDNMDLDLIKSITNRSMLEAIADLTRDDEMEVERENITVLEALGEGAFGLVKKAIIVKEGSKHQVAVKMLKNSVNIDDIKQFHQEISVMKSVGRHPNIVSIIGHCTSNIEELMLLTEFCDAGSLLDLLRSEFAKQLNFYDKKYSAAVNPQKYIPDDMHNFDSEEKELSYKNFGCSSRLFVVNQMYDDLNNNNHNETEMHQCQATTLKAIEMTATNALYLQLSDNDPKPVIVEIPEPENYNDFLSSSDLISFAKQVCDGMDFLARKKVIHRDLAARNILVCSDKTAKIADFGLSRDIYQDNIYRKVGNGKLPIKWLAIESMMDQMYTSQSDVWSFGILLYEIVTLGATPYPSIGAEQLLKILNTGYRMEKPKHCHHSLYDVMMSCWHAIPTDRPTFEELSSMLNHFLKMENSWDEHFIDLQKLFDKCSSEMNYIKPIA